MLVLVLVLVGSVAALTLARRLVRHPLGRFLVEFAMTGFLLVRSLFRAVRFVYRFVTGEVRSWRLSRS